MSEDTELKEFIHTSYEQLFSDWRAKFKFSSCLHGVKSNWDLMMFVGHPCYRNSVHVVNFCSNDYPIYGGFDGDGYKRLAANMCRESISNGFNLIRNGKNSYGKKMEESFLAQGVPGTEVTQPKELH